MDDKSIKENIRRKRKAMGISQESMAENMGVANSTYWEIESGSTSILNPNLEKIAEVLGCSVSEIVCGEDGYSHNGYVHDGYGNMLQEDAGTYATNSCKEEFDRKFAQMEEEKNAEIRKIREELEVKNEIAALLRRSIEDKDIIIRMKDRELAALRDKIDSLTAETGISDNGDGN